MPARPVQPVASVPDPEDEPRKVRLHALPAVGPEVPPDPARPHEPAALRLVLDRPHLTAVPPPGKQQRRDSSEDDGIPAPNPDYVRALAVQGYETLTGDRTVAQLSPLISVGLARRLVAIRSARRDRELVNRDRRRGVPSAEGVRITRNSPRFAEAAVVLHFGGRAIGVAMRLEWAHRHWRACELVVL